MPKTIFIVDDNDTNLLKAEEALENLYRVMTLPSAAKMFDLLENVVPDLILLDIEMSGMNGVDALKKLKASRLFMGIPVIFLTSRNDSEIEAQGFELGAVDFISKPFSAPVLINRIKMHLNIDEVIHERTAQLKRLQYGIVSVLADMVENRDKGTGGHIERTSAYIQLMLDAMIKRGVYVNEIRGWDLEMAISSARLHDVGKIAISDFIVNKPGQLTDEEFNTMKTHAAEGERIIDQIVERTGEVEFLNSAKLFAGYHHERWDGSGYPHGKKETDIPLQGRIMAIADVYDALVSDRPYKKAMSDDEAVSIIMASAGRQFDPKLTEVFFNIKEKFRSRRESF